MNCVLRKKPEFGLCSRTHSSHCSVWGDTGCERETSSIFWCLGGGLCGFSYVVQCPKTIWCSLIAPVWMWACEVLIKTLLVISQQLNEVGFTWHPTALRATKEGEVFSHCGEFYQVNEENAQALTQFMTISGEAKDRSLQCKWCLILEFCFSPCCLPHFLKTTLSGGFFAVFIRTALFCLFTRGSLLSLNMCY